jgi:xanthine dehydrogenase YagR molybdenum-binding subunit
MAESTRIGQPTPRIDARPKVTGAARYAADVAVARPAYAALVTSAIARGRVSGIDDRATRAVPGFLDLLTHANAASLVKSPRGPDGGATTTTMESDRIWHDGQIIALVVGETMEAAREAANRLVVDYVVEQPSASFDSPGAEILPVATVDEKHQDPSVGDANAAFAKAPVKIDGRFETPTQHHNPLELFSTTCAWQGDHLTIYESSQFVHALRAGVARQLGIEPAQVRVISSYIGGGFGSRGGPTSRTAWVAVAAKRLGRPVKLEPRRQDGFTIATYRAETRHHMQLAAGRDGKLQALIHESWEATSRPSHYNVSGVATTSRLYACPNVRTQVHVARLDRNTPGFMRAPPETPYLFPLECAMDELAYALNMDPLALRRINDTHVEPIKGLPYSSRHLVECLDAGAKAFGWSRRTAAPGSMRDGEWLIGMGCASAAYHASIGASTARVLLSTDGRAVVQTAAHEIGTGALTIIAMTAADRLGLPIEQVSVEAGDSDLPPAGLAAGSTHAASTCNVVAKACEMIRARLAQAAVATNSPLAGLDPATLQLRDGLLQAPDGKNEPLKDALARTGRIEVYAENIPPGAPPNGAEMLYNGQVAMARGTELEKEIRYSFGAQFVEVGVHARTREVRVRRATGAFAAGRIMNPVTARSQFMGGMIWGISAALHEATEIDMRTARYYNDDLAEYLIPVNADIPEVDVIFIPEEDSHVNPLGIKGIGELGTTGMNAAVANAVFHATGVRIRELPIRIEKLLVA